MLSINEKLLHFIWQFQYFNKHNLCTTEDEPINIIHSGHINTNQGPDFLDARINIAETLWAGHVEIHVLSSDWYKHNHQSDSNYENVILHVVWQQDKPVYDSKGNLIPSIELQSLTSKSMLQRYELLMQSQEFIACKQQLKQISSLVWFSWKERLVTERFERKAEYILTLFKEAQNSWEEVLWWMIARNFGIKINAEIFEKVGKTIPINILAKSKYQLHHIEALLLGQANLLPEEVNTHDAYVLMLKKEYAYLKAKYSLPQQTMKPLFLRMRPANFPSIRMAQLAMLIFKSKNLFSILRDSKDVKEIYTLFDVQASEYWNNHYVIGEEAVMQIKRLGISMINNIIINTVTPVLFAYGKYLNDDIVKEKALKWLEYAALEHNSITKQWMDAGAHNRCAMDSQALIELYQYYCKEKKCLQCAVGNKLLKN